MRFELTTFSLATRCSTTELRPHIRLVILEGDTVRKRADNSQPPDQCKAQIQVFSTPCLRLYKSRTNDARGLSVRAIAR